jgi:hypothetical protein
MPPEIISALIGLIGIILGVIPTYIFMRQKGLAEIEKTRAEADKTKAEAEKIRSEIKVNAKNESNKSSESAQADQKEIGFLSAFLAFIKPDTDLSDRYSDMISRQFVQLSTEVNKLEKNQDWQTLLFVKQRLREYFEYSGKYCDGVEFGRMYVRALDWLKQPEEAIWTKVKHVGYLLILAEQHELGRREILDALERLSILPVTRSDSVYECYFYCYRYLGISYQRDTISGDMKVAKEYFQKARECIDFFKHNERKRRELHARLLGNLGNVALTERRFSDALNNYKESHDLFVEVGDREHIGIAKFKIAQTRIASKDGIEDAPALLDAAHLMFIEIGWLEGEARIAEQYARYYEYKAEKSDSGTEKYIELALNYVHQSQSLYRRIGLAGTDRRIDELQSRLEDMAKGK